MHEFMQILHHTISRVLPSKPATVDSRIREDDWRHEQTNIETERARMNTSTKYNNTAPSAEEIRAATAALKDIRTTMNLTSLTTEERVEYQQDRVNRIALRLLEDRLLAARESRDLLPVSFDLRRFERDTQLTRTLHDCLCFIEEIRTALKDTLLVVKSCAAQAALVADGHLKVA